MKLFCQKLKLVPALLAIIFWPPLFINIANSYHSKPMFSFLGFFFADMNFIFKIFF